MESYNLNKIYYDILIDFKYDDVIFESDVCIKVNMGELDGVKYFSNIYANGIIDILDSTGKSYSDKVKKYTKIAYVDNLNKQSIPKYVILEFKGDIFNDAGFNENELDVEDDDDDDDYDINEDQFWVLLRKMANVDRQLEIHTYGIKFKQYKNYSKTDRNFNALVITGNKSGNLHKLRGTDPGLQKRVRSGKRFEEVMINIVKTVERDKCKIIGIYCRAGHHRSVACGELLKKFVYINSNITHLTIKR